MSDRDNKIDHMQPLVTEGINSGVGSRTLSDLRTTARQIVEGIQRGERALADGRTLNQAAARQQLKKWLEK